MRRKPICLRNRANDTAWVSGRKAVCRNVSRYNGTCADYTALSDRYAAADGYVCGNPAIILNNDGRSILKVRYASRLFIKKRISIRIAKRMYGVNKETWGQ